MSILVFFYLFELFFGTPNLAYRTTNVGQILGIELFFGTCKTKVGQE